MNTNTPGTLLFRPHGRIEPHRDGAVVITHAKGPFNGEAVRAYGERLVELISELPEGQPYVVIALMHESILAPADAWEALEDGLRKRQASSRKQLGSAWVIDDALEGRALFVPKARALYERLGAQFGVFEDEASAAAWARQLLPKAA
jgi:hypothetical protein